MWIRGVAGVLLIVVGLLWMGQGVGTVHDSPMTGHAQYAVLGALLVIGGVLLLVGAARRRRR
jgi:drug/metabolite transporter (DMT)-like permease